MWTKEEQKEHRKLWIKALRSGEYRQATGALRTENGFCCLGVACEVAVKEDVIKPGYLDVNIYKYGDRCAHGLPEEVQKWLGLNNIFGYYGRYFDDSLAERNDHGATFEEIADLIESEPDGLLSDE